MLYESQKCLTRLKKNQESSSIAFVESLSPKMNVNNNFLGFRSDVSFVHRSTEHKSSATIVHSRSLYRFKICDNFRKNCQISKKIVLTNSARTRINEDTPHKAVFQSAAKLPVCPINEVWHTTDRTECVPGIRAH